MDRLEASLSAMEEIGSASQTSSKEVRVVFYGDMVIKSSAGAGSILPFWSIFVGFGIERPVAPKFGFGKPVYNEP